MIIQIQKVNIIEPQCEMPEMPDLSDMDGFIKRFGAPCESIQKMLDNAMLMQFGEGSEAGDPATRWGAMDIRKEKMTLTERHHSFRHRYSYVGPFRYPHRALLPISDGRAWHHRSSGKGGTVLIDWSSSMSLGVENILEVLKKNPLATVAAYYGDSFGSQSGHLVILSQNNRYSDLSAINDNGGGNVVDGPALKWLARQDRPRIWVSDGGITGICDSMANPAMVVEVARTIKGHDIKWLRNIRELPRALG